MENAKNRLIVMLVGVIILVNVSCYRSKYENATQQLQQAKGDYTRVKDDLKSMQELSDKQFEKLKGIVGDLNKLDSLSLMLKSSPKEINNTTVKFSTYGDDIPSRINKKQTIQEEIDSLIIKIRKNFEQKNNLINEQAKAYESLRSALYSKLEAKEREINQLKEDLREQKEINMTQSNRISDLEITKKDLLQQIEDLKKKRVAIESEMSREQSNAYYEIGAAFERAELDISKLSGSLRGKKKDKALKTKAILEQKSQEFYQKAATCNQKAKNIINSY